MSAVRRIAYLSGTRADFGLMCETLRRIHADPALALSVIATGTHLEFGICRFAQILIDEIDQLDLAAGVLGVSIWML